MSVFISDKQDLSYLNWRIGKNSSGTPGTFLKAEDTVDGVHYYYKLSDYDRMRGIVGHESINELIVSRLLDEIKIPHTNYDLINAKIIVNEAEINNAYVAVSKDFKKRGDRKIAMDEYFEIEHEKGETPLDFCVRMGWKKYLIDMLICDFVILNRDRHGANIELIIKKDGHVFPAPLFDHGLSLMCRAQTDEEVKKFDPLEDKRVQSFIGGNSVLENLKIFPKNNFYNIGRPDNEKIERILQGLQEPLGKVRYKAISRMIKLRWQAYEDFLNS